MIAAYSMLALFATCASTLFVAVQSEGGSSTLLTAILSVVGTLGAGGLVRLYAQYQAGRREAVTDFRAELLARVKTLEARNAELQREMAEMHRELGRLSSIEEHYQELKARVDVES